VDEDSVHNVPRLTQANKICMKHNPMLVNSYHKDTLELLCTNCAYERKIHEKDVIIFPGAIRFIKERVIHAFELNS